MTSVHLLTGDDDLLLQRATERLLDELTSADPELSVDTYDATELEALPELRTQSLFGGRVCAVIRGVQAARADLKGELEDYLEAPDDEAVLVLVAQGTGRIQKIARMAKKAGDVVKVDTPPDWKDDAWKAMVTDEFRRAGRTATPDAVAAILDHAGLDPSVIAMRVSQVAAATDPGGTVGVEDVERIVEGHGRRSGFQLADAVADRDAAQAITLLRGSLESGEAPLALLGALTFRFRQLQQVRGGVAPRMSPGQLNRLKGVSRNFSTGELAWCLDRLAQLDVDLKGQTDLPPDLVLELGVIDLATPREVGAPWNPLAS